MAKYLAGGRVRGTLHGVTYQRNMYTGWVAKEKSGITAEQIATSPAFQRTRENNNEMKGVGLAVKALRGSLSQFLPFVTDPIVTGRMIREVKKAQLQSVGARGQRKIGFQNLCSVMRGFQVSNVYKTDSAAKNLVVALTDGTAEQRSFSISARAASMVWPAGANCAVPFVTTLEVDDVEYFGEAGWDFSRITWQDRISQNILLENAAVNLNITEDVEISYGNGAYTWDVEPGESTPSLDFTTVSIQKNSDEFGRILVWFGIQFGQLVSVPVPEGDKPRLEFYPMRGATAGLVVGDVAPNPAG